MRISVRSFPGSSIDETYIGGKKGPRGRDAKNSCIGIKDGLRQNPIELSLLSWLTSFGNTPMQAPKSIPTNKAYLWLDSSEFAHKSVNH